MDDRQRLRLPETADHISATERTSMEAERNSVDRFTSAYLSDKIGQRFGGRIRSVTRFGLFVELDETGADGFIPMRSLPDDYYVHDERHHALVGKRSGRIYRLGARLDCVLREADGLTGSTLLTPATDLGADLPGFEHTLEDLDMRGGDNRRGGFKGRKGPRRQGGGNRRGGGGKPKFRR
jgi:ribonuclease R